ncbi:MAG: pilus assembly protein PilO [Gammaproteobacteria bacterium]|nr:MAG: pilus assembly protein PilO [Gammaproteobacteria bacterium]
MAIDLAKIKSDLESFDVNDLKNIGTAPVAVRAIVIAVVVITILGLGYYFDTKDQLLRLEQLEKKELDLRRKFEARQRKAANLEAYKAQLEEMRTAFGAMLRQLPSETEIPSLLVDISETGLRSGLTIDLFQPQAEAKKGFYAEKPIKLEMRGTYEEMAHFASGVATLPRIVTLHDIQITPAKNGALSMKATAKTYRYLEDNE